MKKERIWLSPPHLDGNERKYVQDAFDSNWVAPVGPHLSLFEKELEGYLGQESSVAVLSSGTAAIHLALIILGIKSGDFVLCSSFTFAGSCNPIMYLGATPVFIDSEPSTWNMDPKLLRQSILDLKKNGNTPKAIILVHLYGMPARLVEILNVAAEHNIPIIEDAAEALGSTYNAQRLGTFGEIGILSFNGNKIITTSGGGAMISKDSRYTQKAKFLSTQARADAPHYEHAEVGYNYRLSNVSAAIGRGQLERIGNKVEKRRSIYEAYVAGLQGVSDIQFCPEPEGSFSNRWLTTVLFKNYKEREKVRLALERENIESRPLWKPMHLQPLFSEAKSYVNGISEDLFNRGLCLPSGSNLGTDDQKLIINLIKNDLKAH